MSDAEFERYVLLYRKCVCTAAFYYVKNVSDADDITQDVFFRLYTYSGSFESDEQVKAWLLRCAINRSKDVLRSHWYRFSAPLDAAADKVYVSTDDKALLSVLEKLGRNNRVTLYMFYYEGYTGPEIAKILGISERAVSSRLRRGRAQLKKLLADERNDSDDGLQRLF